MCVFDARINFTEIYRKLNSLSTIGNLYLTVIVSSVTVMEGEERSAPTLVHVRLSAGPPPEHLMTALPPWGMVWSAGDIVTDTDGHMGLVADAGVNRDMGPSLCSW